MKKSDIQDQLSRKGYRAYYTMTYTGEDATHVVNFKASDEAKSKKFAAKLLILLFMVIGTALLTKILL